MSKPTKNSNFRRHLASTNKILSAIGLHLAIVPSESSSVEKGKKVIHQLFEEKSIENPCDMAVICADVKISYADLNGRANQLAHYLQENMGVKKGDIVTLCLDRS